VDHWIIQGEDGAAVMSMQDVLTTLIGAYSLLGPHPFEWREENALRVGLHPPSPLTPLPEMK
jgi:hypothetical protein